MFQEKRAFDVGRLGNISVCDYLKRALGKYGDQVFEKELFSNSAPDGSDAVLVKCYAAGGLSVNATISPRKDYRVLDVFVQTQSSREGRVFLEQLVDSMTDSATLSRIQKSLDKELGIK